MTYIVVAHDRDPDLSWLERDDDPADHVTLEMTAYDDAGEVVDNRSQARPNPRITEMSLSLFTFITEHAARVVAHAMSLQSGQPWITYQDRWSNLWRIKPL
jgi:hypothetical protein